MRSTRARKKPTYCINFFIVLLLLLHAGCAHLPDFASPHLSTVPFDAGLDFVEYRQLTLEDFKAQTPPAAIKGYEHRINAHTSVSLRPSTPIHYTISHPNQNFGVYKARLEQLWFKAVMLPAYSWWNPKLHRNRTAYVLQHEQVHFALMEIAARRLNEKLQHTNKQTFSGKERAVVQQQLLTTVQKTIDDSKTEILKEHTRFDEDTSLEYNPRAQQDWYDNCQTELQRLSKWAQ